MYVYVHVYIYVYSNVYVSVRELSMKRPTKLRTTQL